jgi:hypothetical protein
MGLAERFANLTITVQVQMEGQHILLPLQRFFSPRRTRPGDNF